MITPSHCRYQRRHAAILPILAWRQPPAIVARRAAAAAPATPHAAPAPLRQPLRRLFRCAAASHSQPDMLPPHELRRCWLYRRHYAVLQRASSDAEAGYVAPAASCEQPPPHWSELRELAPASAQLAVDAL